MECRSKVATPSGFLSAGGQCGYPGITALPLKRNDRTRLLTCDFIVARILNIANFSPGRREGGIGVAEAVALVSTDELVPESVLAQLREHEAVKVARSVEFKA